MALLDEILHHFETTGNHCRYLQGNHYPSGFLRWCERISSIHSTPQGRVIAHLPRIFSSSRQLREHQRRAAGLCCGDEGRLPGRRPLRKMGFGDIFCGSHGMPMNMTKPPGRESRFITGKVISHNHPLRSQQEILQEVSPR